MKNKEITRIRGHHLPNLGWKLDKKELGKFLEYKEYIDDGKHQFVEDSYGFIKRLQLNQNHLIKPIVGEKDFICEKCPVRIEKKCLDFNPENHFLSKSIFFNSIEKGEKKDIDLIKKCGLEIGQIYTVGEIIKATIVETYNLEQTLKKVYI